MFFVEVPALNYSELSCTLVDVCNIGKAFVCPWLTPKHGKVAAPIHSRREVAYNNSFDGWWSGRRNDCIVDSLKPLYSDFPGNHHSAAARGRSPFRSVSMPTCHKLRG